MTYGEIRLRCSQLLPGISHDLLDGWLSDRYTQILDSLKWQRRKVRSIIQTAAPYATGTIALTEGSQAVTGTDTAWTSANSNGCALWVPARNEFYEFTYASATSGTLDRPYEGGDDTELGYKLYQSVYPLPSDCRILESVNDLQNGPLFERTRRDANDGVGVHFGPPLEYADFMDDLSDPPRMQIEIFPIPEVVTSLSIEYTAEEATFGTTTATTLLPWLRPGCLVSGVQADGLNHKATLDPAHANVYFNASDRAERQFSELLGTMRRTETANRPPKSIRIKAVYESGEGFDLTAYRRSLMP